MIESVNFLSDIRIPQFNCSVPIIISLVYFSIIIISRLPKLYRVGYQFTIGCGIFTQVRAPANGKN